MIPMMLVTGVTGVIGERVMRDLLARGHKVRALLRDAHKADPALAGKVEYVVADYTRPETLRKALKGVDKAFLVVPSHLEPASLKGPFLQAANEARVQHVVTVSTFGADPDSPVRLFRAHGEADGLVKRSGLTYTILRSHFFMQNLLGMAEGIRHGIFSSAHGTGRIGMIDKVDVGDVAAKVMTTKGHADAVYELTGPRSLSMSDVAAGLSSVLGHAVRYEERSPDERVQDLVGFGVPGPMAEAVAEMEVHFAKGRGDKVTPTVERILDRTPRRFDVFARAHMEAFRPVAARIAS